MFYLPVWFNPAKLDHSKSDKANSFYLPVWFNPAKFIQTYFIGNIYFFNEIYY